MVPDSARLLRTGCAEGRPSPPSDCEVELLPVLRMPVGALVLEEAPDRTDEGSSFQLFQAGCLGNDAPLNCLSCSEHQSANGGWAGGAKVDVPAVRQLPHHSIASSPTEPEKSLEH
eukprot:14782562-Alexandrium_andersonii.AAC.1